METTNVPTAQGAAPGDELTTESGVWAIKAHALGANKDLHVSTSDPLYDKQTVKATVLAVEPVAADGDKGEAARFRFRIEDEMVSTDGTKKAPGGTWGPRFAVTLMEADEKGKERAERDRRDIARKLQAVKLLKRGTPQLGEIYAALDKLIGKQIIIRFTVGEGKTVDPETGLNRKYQNWDFALPASNGDGVAAPSKEDY